MSKTTEDDDIADEEIAFSVSEVRRQLARLCEEAGGVSAWARANNADVATVHGALKGYKGVGISDNLARKIGFKRVIRCDPLRRDLAKENQNGSQTRL